MWNSFSNWDGLQISNLQGDSFSGLRTTRSFEPDGDGTIVDAPVISMGNGAHRKLTELLLSSDIWADRTNFLFLFAKRFAWLMENIAWEPMPAAKLYGQILLWATPVGYVGLGERIRRWKREKKKMSSHTTIRLKNPSLVNVGDTTELLK